MLLTQKAFNEGGRAFASYVAMMLDQARYGTTTEARRKEAFAAFLTPIAKASYPIVGSSAASWGSRS